MKYVLAVSLAFCLVSLIRLGYRYRLTCLYLLASIPAVLAFRSESGWLHLWYPLIAVPVSLLRVIAGVEVLHRQTEGFRFWYRLIGSGFLLAGMFAGLVWVQSANSDTLQYAVEMRRLVQIWLAADFIVVELFWATQNDAPFCRRADQIALLFGVVAVNHGAISFLSGLGPWEHWWTASAWSWWVDAAAYLLLGLKARLAPAALSVHQTSAQ
jgi:hypothetical protein